MHKCRIGVCVNRFNSLKAATCRVVTGSSGTCLAPRGNEYVQGERGAKQKKWWSRWTHQLYQILKCELSKIGVKVQILIPAKSGLGKFSRVVLGDNAMPKSAKSPKSQQGDRVPYVKAKSLYFMQVCKLDLSACPMYWNKRIAPSSVTVEFYSSRKGVGEGFLRFRTPDWLTFV